jgi:5-methyltetrahydropteroyltriglutamate--homocysteine methyltransferase
MITDRTSKLPPFFTQVIGSLPRPKLVRHLVMSHSDHTSEDFFKLMNDMVIFAIRLQEEAGLDVISDGEWRRVQYVNEFLNRIGGFSEAWKFQHQGKTKYHPVVVRRMEAGAPVFREDAEFLVRNTDRVTKFALASPFLIATRYWHEDYSKDAYATRFEFMQHLAEILAIEAKALEQSGIDIIQLDDPAMTYFCDKKMLSGVTHDDRLRQTWEPDRQMPEAVECINMIVEGLKVEVQLHCCHSVYKRMSDVSGSYAPILPRLKDAKVDRINLEFAYKETGDISDLKLLPDQMQVGMGVVDVRTEQPQAVEDIIAIAEAGARAIAPSRIALNPDCGFAPDLGEPPSIDEAFEKLTRLTQAAKVLREQFAHA